MYTLLENNGINRVLLPHSSSSHDTLGRSLLNQRVGIPTIEQCIPILNQLIPTHDQHILIFTPGFNQDILAHAIDFYIRASPSASCT